MGRTLRRREKGLRHGEGGSAKTQLASHIGRASRKREKGLRHGEGGRAKTKLASHMGRHCRNERKAFGMGRGAEPRQNWPRTWGDTAETRERPSAWGGGQSQDKIGLAHGATLQKREKGLRHGEGGRAKTKLA